MKLIDESTSKAVEAQPPTFTPDVANRALYQKLLDYAPLLTTEDKDLYREMFDGVLFDIQPQSLIEWLSVRDIVDKRFEERRYQRLKVEMLEYAREPRDIPTMGLFDHGKGQGLERIRKCLPHVETLSRMETNCANFRRTVEKGLMVTTLEERKSPSVVPE